MSYARQFSPSDDVSGLAEALVSSAEARVLLLNCYEFCRANFVALRNARLPESRWASLYSRLRKELLDVLERNHLPGRPLIQSKLTELRDRIIATGLEEALVRAAALLTALSLYLRDKKDEPRLLSGFKQPVFRATPQFGGREYFVTQDSPSAVMARLSARPRLPRLDEEIAETIARYHHGVRITPRLSHRRAGPLSPR